MKTTEYSQNASLGTTAPMEPATPMPQSSGERPVVSISVSTHPEVTYELPLLEEVLRLLTQSNASKVDPLTVPNLAGELPHAENGYIYKIHDGLSDNEIDAIFRFYQFPDPF